MWVVMLALAAAFWVAFFCCFRNLSTSAGNPVLMVLAYTAAACFTAYGVHLVTGISYDGLSYALLIGGLLWVVGGVVWACWSVRAGKQRRNSTALESKE